MDEIRFKKIIDEYQKNQSNKIGTLSERTLHAVLKKYLCENEEYHEVKVGSFYADTYDGVYSSDHFPLSVSLSFE